MLAAALAVSSLGACASSSSSATTKAGETPAPTGEQRPGESKHATGGAKLEPLVATQYGDALASLGLNANELPPMDKLTPEQVRKVMNLFTRSLGVDCKFCHKGGDFKAPTEHKKLAERMWNEWVHGKKLVTADATGPVFCDSCHQGRAEILDKSNHDALAKWMKDEFVDRLKPVSGEMSCETCHGKPFDGDFLEKWEKL